MVGDTEHLQLWDESTNTMRFIPGDYEFYIGTSSKLADLKKYTMTITKAEPTPVADSKSKKKAVQNAGDDW